VTYVVDEEGTIAAVFHHEFQVLRHMDDVRQFFEKRSRTRSIEPSSGPRTSLEPKK
jgi:hypothetical protein